MPKPYLLTRPSGLYARYFVPEDLQSVVGSRFIVKTLAGLRGDSARLLAETYAVALASAFRMMRATEEAGVADIDVKKMLEEVTRAQERGELRHWTGRDVQVGRLVNFGEVTTKGAKDTQDFIKTVQAILEADGPGASESIVQSKQPDSPLLSLEITNHISDLERRRLSSDTITESKHSLRILVGVIGDMPVNHIKATHIRSFWEGVRWWPANATVKPAFRDLSVQAIIEKGKGLGIPMPSPHTLNKHRQRLNVFFKALEDSGVIDRSPLRGTGGKSTPTANWRPGDRLPTKNSRPSLRRRTSCPGRRSIHIDGGGRCLAFIQAPGSTKWRSCISKT